MKHGQSSSKSDSKADSTTEPDPKPAPQVITEDGIAVNEEARLLEMSRRASLDSLASCDEDDQLMKLRGKKRTDSENPVPVVEKLKAKIEPSGDDNFTDSNNKSVEKDNEPCESVLDRTKGIVDEQPILDSQQQIVSEAPNEVLNEENIVDEDKKEIVDEELILNAQEQIVSNESPEDVQIEEQLKNIPPKEEEKVVELDDGIPFVVKEKMKPFDATSDEKATVTVKLSKPAHEFKWFFNNKEVTPDDKNFTCLLYTSPSPRDRG